MCNRFFPEVCFPHAWIMCYVCHYFPTNPVWAGFVQKSPAWGLVQNQSSMCYCLQTYEQLPLELQMSAATCPQAPSEQILPRNLLPWRLTQNETVMCYCLQTYKQLTLPLKIFATTCSQARLNKVFAQKSASSGLVQNQSITCYCLKTYEELTLQLKMCATTCHQAPSEQVLPRNLLLWGFRKMKQLCAIVFKSMNNRPCNCKCVPLPTHELRLNRVLPGNLLSGGLCKINQLCTVVYKLSFLWRVGYDVLGLEDKMNARLFGAQVVWGRITAWTDWTDPFCDIGLPRYGLFFRARALASPHIKMVIMNGFEPRSTASLTWLWTKEWKEQLLCTNTWCKHEDKTHILLEVESLQGLKVCNDKHAVG